MRDGDADDVDPGATKDAICCSVALSAVFVVVIDCTEIGASPPTATPPTWSCQLTLRWVITASLSAPHHLEVTTRSFGSSSSKRSSRCRAEGWLPADHRDRVGGRGRQQHRLHVGVAVLALVGVQVLGPDLEVVVPVVRALVRHQLDQMAAEVVERAVLPLVDQSAQVVCAQNATRRRPVTPASLIARASSSVRSTNAYRSAGVTVTVVVRVLTRSPRPPTAGRT